MNKILALLSICALTNTIHSQSFAPAAGQPGSTAIHKDSSVFIGWATNCTVQRGYINIEDPSLGFATFGEEAWATGPATGISTNAVSLGDGGMATLTFDLPIGNGAGPDFAIFENGVTDGFLEFGFVEVSSDGIHFVRFPAISEISTDTQVGGFGIVDCRYVHNLAGKYRVGFGTPFDLEDIKDSANIDINSITHVRIVDVVGSINPLYATYDSQGNMVNNLHPTPFESAGFDLEAVGIIHAGVVGVNKLDLANFDVYPNPSNGLVKIRSSNTSSIKITDMQGKIVYEAKLTAGIQEIDLRKLENGMYLVTSENGGSRMIVINL
ncbi:MAG TPA: T9SS type A sorting domain-containing protein [Taishania sp.]|nr:T9SS type A sorting domain-containing protein [Taishania sp.]